ncbi:MAG: AAA family ATPase, partial [Chloroflexota bacterium]
MNSRLLSLELQGYKTFANQTLFEFPGMVTAIVGPNGTGKSNIADAIRWVLGEQSYSLLRAKKTVDMIFSGSDQRPRAGMTSVSITFNNEDNWLPIDYSEVVLTRRAYRDGQNEYLINNQKVRLRDVHELLAQTGLADRTYTIIGQGLVDVALAIRPDERRRLFEEAAGIGLYRSRKEETLRRLDNTRRNLDRVLDIMAEIKPRLRSLERQAGKAAEYKQLQSDLNVLLRDWYGYYWFKSQKEIRVVQQLCKEQERFLEESHRKQSTNQVDLELIRHDMQIQRDELNSFHKELAQFYSELGHIGRDLAVLDERKRSVISQNSQLELDIAYIEEKIKSREITKQNIIIEFDQLSKEFEEADRQFKDINDQVGLRIHERQSLESAIEKIRNERVYSETSIIKISAKKTEFSERVDDLNINITQSQNSFKELESK